MNPSTRPLKSLIRPAIPLVAGAAVFLAAGSSALAGSFYSDFNSGLPGGAAVYGTAAVIATGGYTNSGYLQLTPFDFSKQGAFVITNDLDAGAPVVSFVARFKAYDYSAGAGADGWSFNFGSDVPFGNVINEEGPQTDPPYTGLTVEYDTYANTGESAGIDVKTTQYWDPTAHIEYTAPLSDSILRPNAWVDVVIMMHPDKTLDVVFDGTWVHTNVATYLGNIAGGHFAFGGRTGSVDDPHWIEDLSIVTQTNEAAFLDYYSPIGRTARGDAPIHIVLSDYYNPYTGITTAINTNRITLQLDGATVSPAISQSLSNGITLTAVQYTPALLASGSSHAVSITFEDDAVPSPNTNTWQYGYTVNTYPMLPTNFAAAASLVSTNRGFALRFSQIEPHFGNTILRAENQLAGLIINPGTSLPYPNIATPVNGTFTYTETNAINYSAIPDKGNFAGDAFLPGLPGTTGGTTNYAMDAITYLYLPPGLYTLGVNSSDGFRLTAASTPDVFATQEAVYDGVRTPETDTTLTFGVAEAGYYPFRICYFVGGIEQVNPTTNNPSLEFFSVNAAGEKVLINGTNLAGSVPVFAYQPAQTLPYIRTLSPAPGAAGMSRNTAIDAYLVDGTITVQTNAIFLSLNGTTVAPAITRDSGLVTVHYQPAAPLALNSTNTVQIVFQDSAANWRTNSYKFVVENILTQLWKINGGSSSWVTTGGTERGLAYNPKTGHVLLVSRSGASPVNGLGVAIMNGDTGAVIGQLNLGDIATTGTGTYKLNMLDIAEDGVIYICNLSVNSSEEFRIYRWQNESAAPTIAFQGYPPFVTGAPSRVGDDFRVRGSGAGTQIIVFGNNTTVSTVPFFTTVDGTNFTPTVLSVTGMPANAVRLGLAFGCGNTFYGKTTGANMPYVSFNGPPSTAASQTASYTIYSGSSLNNIAAIGVDIINQRLIGNGTGQSTQPHTMNLYELTALTAGVTNYPLDYKVFDSQTGTFGTGSVDFTPDGTRVYTLDTANGIIAFSLNPKLAVPVICAQPRTNIVAGLGSIGYMDVTAIGAPQYYQWRFNGANIAGATNRTLDMYNVQQSQLGFYSVVITNAMGSVTSSVAVLDTQIVVTAPPTNQLVPIGGTAIFNVGVTGGLPALTFQWKLNGTDLPGANGNTLTVSGAQQANAGAYTVTVTDSLGQTITSQAAALTVGTLGTGTGLMGAYYNNMVNGTGNFAGVPTLTRVDETVDFDWGTTGSPDWSIGPDYFMVRWYGQVQPLYTQPYTFYTRTDDGARLWVNGQLMVNRWQLQGPTEFSGTIPLTAYQKYDLLMEYYENASGAVAQLRWSSTNQVKEIIPKTQLYPGELLRSGVNSSLVDGTNLVLNWVGTCILESATNVVGPWSAITTNTGPFTNAVGSAPEMYFRLISQQSF